MKQMWTIVVIAFLILPAGCDLSGHELDDPDDDDGKDDDDGDDDDCTDQDQDNWCTPEDCNDFDASTHPGAAENCYDLVDNDCDGMTDQEDSDCPADTGDDDEY